MSINHRIGGPDATVQEMAAGQHGVISRRQAIEAGVTARMIERRTGSGLWVAVHPGVYRLAGAPETWQQRLLGACLATGGVASHRAAARLWGLDLPSTERLVVTVMGTSRRSCRGALLHHTRSLLGADRAVREGIPCTSVARTLVDLAGEVGFDDLEACVDSALRDNLATVRYLERWLPAQGKGGTAGLRELVDDRRRHRPFGSRREALVSRMLVAAGLPRPTAQHELRDERGRFLARFDLAWPDWRVAVEFASYRHHFGRRAWRSDTARANRATAHGWRVLTATDLDLGDACRSLASGVGAARAGLSSVPA
jgi:hypothetical protein